MGDKISTVFGRASDVNTSDLVLKIKLHILGYFDPVNISMVIKIKINNPQDALPDTSAETKALVNSPWIHFRLNKRDVWQEAHFVRTAEITGK